MRRLLLSNDDGVHAPGLRALHDALLAHANIRVVAPDRDRSGASNSLTLSRPLSLTPLDNGFYSVDGTPADCVYLGVHGVWDEKPDLVISGINHGSNLGDDVLYSGTVAAAMEGRNLGMTAIAMSLCGERHFATAARVAGTLIGVQECLARHVFVALCRYQAGGVSPFLDTQPNQISRANPFNDRKCRCRLCDQRTNSRPN